MTLEQMIEQDTTVDEYVDDCIAHGMDEEEALQNWDYIFQTALIEAINKGHELKFTT